MSDQVVTITQTKAGEAVEYRGQRSRTKRTIQVNREWAVDVNGEFVGTVRYGLLNRERKSPGKRYVNARRDSPGWTYIYPGQFRGVEAYSKTEAIDRLISSRTN